MKMNAASWPVAVLAVAVAALAAAAAEPGGGPAAGRAAGNAITDAQFDKALAAAEAQKQGPAFTTPLQSVAPRFREGAKATALAPKDRTELLPSA